MPTVACSLAELYGELEFTYAASLTRLWDATKMDTEIRQSFGHDGPPEEELRHSPSTALHAAAACVGYSKQQHAQIVAEAAMGCDVQPTGGAGRSPPRHAAVPEPGFGYTHSALKVGTGGTWPGVFQKILSLCGRAGVHFAQKEGDVLARSDRPLPAADRLPRGPVRLPQVRRCQRLKPLPCASKFATVPSCIFSRRRRPSTDRVLRMVMRNRQRQQ